MAPPLLVPILSALAPRLRIIALPLVRKHGVVSLTYYHFVSPPRIEETSTSPPKLLQRLSTYGNRVKLKITELWVSFGKAPGGWKLKTYTLGERISDKLDWEEHTLKALQLPTGALSVPKATAPLIYPRSFPTSAILKNLETMLAQRTPLHRKRFWTFAIIAPFMTPLMIVPVIPNLPFFFCAWRAWSHFQASEASAYLQTLTAEGFVKPESDDALSKIYAQSTTTVIAKGHGDLTAPPYELLLSAESVPSIIAALNLPETAGTDIYRAIEQARSRSRARKY